MASVRGVFWAAAAVLCGVAAGAQAAPPPASAFGRVPAVVDAEISPDGQRIAILGGASEQRVISIATIDQPGLPVLQLGDVETTDLLWAGNDYVIATVAYWEKTSSKTAYRMERHIAVNMRAEAVSRFLDNRSAWAYSAAAQPILGVIAGPQARLAILDIAEAAGGAIVSAIWSVDPATGKGKLTERADWDTRRWEVDSTGEARVRFDSGRVWLFVRPKGKDQWVAVTFPEKDQPRYYGYSEPEDAIYLLQGDKLVRRRNLDGATETVSEGDVAPALLWDSHRNAAVGIETGGERPVVKWMDPELGVAQGILARAFRDRNVRLMSWSADRSRFIARVSAPGAPPVWYLYDKNRKEISPLGEEYPGLAGAPLGLTRWITYKARDGLQIPAYVTMPPDAAKSGKKPPIIVLPHGGPKMRDPFDFDFLAQFLATRGYAVLQPQFRGSSGFGKAFEDEGMGEWGGKMQTDLLDGVAALGATGQVDASRVCIVGASFGGYAALAGATLFLADYQCAASIAGVSDLAQLILEEGRLYGRDSGAAQSLRTELVAADRTKIAAMSPLRRVTAATPPILLIHGDKDTVVQVAQSERMAEVLKAAGKPYELLILQNENHYLTRTATRTQTLEALERFLAKNLPVN